MNDPEAAFHADLLAFVQKIAAMKMCNDPGESVNCLNDSGPYCGRHHPVIVDEEISEARALVAKVARG